MTKRVCDVLQRDSLGAQSPVNSVARSVTTAFVFFVASLVYGLFGLSKAIAHIRRERNR